MTATEAKANQDRIAQHFNLGWWYGVNCKKCCGVFPKLMTTDTKSWYECEVCHRQSKKCDMPWIAEKDWNEGETSPVQMDIYMYL